MAKKRGKKKKNVQTENPKIQKMKKKKKCEIFNCIYSLLKF